MSADLPRRAVFLDRDGVLNPPVVRDGKPYPPASVEEFSIYPEAAQACIALKNAGFILVVATNQPDVGRGAQRREIIEAMHAKLMRELPIDRIEVSYDGGDEKPPSEFRKPRPGMLLRSAQELRLDLAACWMVGDRWRDIDCGHAAGCRTVFINRGYVEELRQAPDFIVINLAEAARIIVEHTTPPIKLGSENK